MVGRGKFFESFLSNVFSIAIEKDTWMVEMCEQVGEGLQWNPVLQTVT